MYLLLISSVFLSYTIEVDLVLLFIVLIFTLKVPFAMLTRGLIPILIFLTFTFLSNVLFQTGKPIYRIIGFVVTEEGLRNGGHLTLRILILVIGAKILTSTTSAEDLVKAMTRLLGPVAKIRAVREFLFIMSLTLRFLPIIYDEAQTLYTNSVKNSHETTIMGKIRISASLLTPLFERSLKRARELQALDAD